MVYDAVERILPLVRFVDKSRPRRFKLGISRPYIWKLFGQGAFPRPLHLGWRARAWRSDEIDA